MSTLYAKPSWQSGTGVPADGKRDVPDVSLTAAGHDGYLIYQEGGMYVVGGTSAASPSFAGIMALVVQDTGARQGNANTTFYPLAIKQRAGGALVFHDITSGNDSVPGLTGYSATTGYDQATGLGSVDASVLVTHWRDGNIVPTFQLAAQANSISVAAGSNETITLTVAVNNGFNASVAFSITGLPAGITGTFTPATLSAPGSGSSVLKLTATTAAKPGVYSASIGAASGSTKQTVALSITVPPTPTFTMASSSPSISLSAGASHSLTIATTPTSTFNSTITLAVAGLPASISLQVLPSSVLAAPGAGATTITFSAASNAVAKAYPVTLTATGGGITQKETLTVNVPGFSLSQSAATATVSSTAKTTLKFSTLALGGLSSPIAFSISGLPSGVTASFNPQTIASPGGRSTTLTLTKAAGSATGVAHVSVTASGGSFTQTSGVTLTVK
jgi:hypothetical protein